MPNHVSRNIMTPGGWWARNDVWKGWYSKWCAIIWNITLSGFCFPNQYNISCHVNHCVSKLTKKVQIWNHLEASKAYYILDMNLITSEPTLEVGTFKIKLLSQALVRSFTKQVSLSSLGLTKITYQNFMIKLICSLSPSPRFSPWFYY